MGKMVVVNVLDVENVFIVGRTGDAQFGEKWLYL